MAKETRKLRRAAAKKEAPSGKELRAQFKQPSQASGNAPDMPDPFGPEQLKKTFTRVGLIVGAVWLVGGLIAGLSPSRTVVGIALGIPAVATVVVVGVVVWMMQRTKSAREVAEVLRGISSEEDRQAALAKLSSGKTDTAKIFARAQLEMQEDPKKALATLEEIDLSKVMAPVADEARAQRAMIHLTLGQVNLARQLVDNIEIKRAQDDRSRAMIGAIVAETWARSGEAKKALETLSLFDLNSEQLASLKPQILRAYAYAYAHTSKSKDLRRVLRQLAKVDVRLLGGFLQGKNHPLLTREAKKVVEQSGMVPKKMQVQRMR